MPAKKKPVAAKRKPAAKPKAKKVAKVAMAPKPKVASSRKPAAKKPPFDFDGFAADARALQSKLEQGKTKFGMGSYQRFNLDQTRAVMEFFNDGELKLSARAQIVGSYSSNSDTWLWSWENESLLPGVTKDLEHVRQFHRRWMQ